VPRYRRVRVEALDEHGNPVVVVGAGWYARILQHELDHLRGVVCCDRMESRTLTTHDNHLRHWRQLPIADVRATLGDMPGED
jgi:peptide deformylase